jgi:hypothetical protein
MNGDAEVIDNFYSPGLLTTQGLRDLAKRREGYKDTHGDIAVLTFSGTKADGRTLGMSYVQIADAFTELADRRDRETFEQRERIAGGQAHHYPWSARVGQDD